MESTRPWLGAAAPQGGLPTPAPAGGKYPPAGWPAKESLAYTKELITCALLVLALPWLVVKLITDPGLVLSGLGRRAANRAGSG